MLFVRYIFRPLAAGRLCVPSNRLTKFYNEISEFVLFQKSITMPAFQIQDSVAFVTGTNKKNGIGRAIVAALLENGAKKVYATARNVDCLDDLVEQYPEKVVPVALDVTDFSAIEKLSEKCPDVNLVVNNAGYFGGTDSLGDLSIAKMEIDVNYLGPMAIVKAFSKQLKLSSNAAIVTVASIASLISFPGGGTYAASKAAMHSLTQTQRRDFTNALVMGVYPGPIDTDMAKDVPFEKASTASVAAAIIEALTEGKEDLYPDPMSVQLFEGWKGDAKAMEKQMSTMTTAPQ